MTADAVATNAPAPLDEAVVASIAERVLWLSTRMVHEANVVRPSDDGLKVGGHQASSASSISILTALYFHWLGPHDLVAVKPHASPAYHAIQYLLGNLATATLRELRAFGGIQAYPSRTKDHDRVDFSTGSVGLGAVAPLFASFADRYIRAQGIGAGQALPTRRFVAVIGDAELDEGNIWEAALEDALRGIGNVTVIVDLNRQSLDRVIPGIRVRQLQGMFAAAGWHVGEAKYGRRLQAVFRGKGGGALRRRIDEMANDEYQVLIRRAGRETRARLVDGAPTSLRDELARSIRDVPDDDLPAILADLGGHDMLELLRSLDGATSDPSRPAVLFAYTVKGWGLPFAGDALNHSALLSGVQIEELALRLGVDPTDPWAAFPAGTAAADLCARRGACLRDVSPGTDSVATEPDVGMPIPDLEIRPRPTGSTQEAFGEAMGSLARLPAIGPRVVTASPDVTISTSLGGWVNRVGVFAIAETPTLDDTLRPLKWAPTPSGRHIELGISEMNLFMWLSQFGLTDELFGERLVPIGTVYDPFICRGLDALIYALYVGSRFVLVGTPSGVTLAPEGGAHQSTITPSIGIELPGLHAYEPAFAQEAAWLLVEAVRGVLDTTDGFSTYLRLSTRVVSQELAEPVQRRLGTAEWRRQVIAGGYRLIESADAVDLPPEAPIVNVIAMGSAVTEAAAAVHVLHGEEVAANLIVVSSADRLSAELHDSRLKGVRDRVGGNLRHLETLFPEGERHVPMVTVVDGASHSLSFLGSVYGAPVVPLGADTFGQSGTISDLYRYQGIDANHVIDAALLALDLA